MAHHMRAAVLRKLRTPLKIEKLPEPEPGPGELLIRIAACGVCHSDLHAIDGDWTPGPVLPLIPGHEVTGHVVALGSGVAGFKIGEPVGVPWMFSACGACEYCLSGQETICRNGRSTGYSMPGGYAELMVAPAAFVGRLPKNADLFALAPILCAGVTTYRGLKRAEVRPGQWVTVLGVGGLGHIAIQYAVAMGLRVAAVDVDDAKLRLARRLGAEVAVNATRGDPAAAVKKRTGGTHGAIVTTASPRAFEQAVGLLRGGGTCVYIGLARRQEGLDPQLDRRIGRHRAHRARLQCRHPGRPRRGHRLRRQWPGDGQDRASTPGAGQPGPGPDAQGKDPGAGGAGPGVMKKPPPLSGRRLALPPRLSAAEY